MSLNYVANKVGVPYVRANQLVVTWPDAKNGLPTATVSQVNAVMLADGTVRELDIIPSIVTTLDFKNDGNKPIPIVDPETGEHVGQDTTLNMTFVQVLAVIRQAQLAQQS